MRRASAKRRRAIKIDLSEKPEASPQRDGGSKRPRFESGMAVSLPILGETSNNAQIDVDTLLIPAVYEKLSSMEDANMLNHCAEHILQVLLS